MSRLFHARFGDVLVPMDGHDFAPFDWPKAGAYPLFPFHNRVVDGLLRFEGREYRIAPHPALTPDAMHGPAHCRPWAITDRDGHSLVMMLDHAPDDGWPFRFRAEQEFSIEEDQLAITLRLANTGQQAMPGGLGWHPYFRAGLERDVETDAAIAYPLDIRNLPLEAAAFPRQSGTVSIEAGQTMHFSQWTQARLQTDGNALVELQAQDGLGHLAVHRMPGYLCVEPVSHKAGTLHLPHAADGEGLRTIRPGRSIEARFRLLLSGCA